MDSSLRLKLPSSSFPWADNIPPRIARYLQSRILDQESWSPAILAPRIPAPWPGSGRVGKRPERRWDWSQQRPWCNNQLIRPPADPPPPPAHTTILRHGIKTDETIGAETNRIKLTINADGPQKRERLVIEALTTATIIIIDKLVINGNAATAV